MPVRGGPLPAATLLVCSTRDRPRALLARAWPRGRVHIHVVRDADAIDAALATLLVDAIVVDLQPGNTAGVGWRAIERATSHAPIPAVGLVAARALEPGLLQRLHTAGVATILVDGVDDAMLRVLLQPILLSTRFTQRADVLLTSYGYGALAESVWRTGVSSLGRLTSVSALAKQLGMSREHLSRSLRAAGSPGPKQLLELARLLVVQALLAEGIPIAVAAGRVGYSSVSHLARVSRAAVGATPRHWGTLSADALIAAATANPPGRVASG